MTESRYIPINVRETLRKEAFFGCVVCGNPILEYHHIVPWSVEHHNRLEDMVAVCPTHHREIAKRPPSYAYERKQNPYNKDVCRFEGELSTAEEITSFVVGGNEYIDTPTVFSYFQIPIFRYRIEAQQALISIFIPDAEFWPEIKVVDNDVVARTSDFWDIEFSTNFLRFRKRKGKNFLSIDLRKNPAKINANLMIGGEGFIFSPSSSNIGSATIRNCRFYNCAGGILYGGPRERLILPNYAMCNPAAWVSLQ